MVVCFWGCGVVHTRRAYLQRRRAVGHHLRSSHGFNPAGRIASRPAGFGLTFDVDEIRTETPAHYLMHTPARPPELQRICGQRTLEENSSTNEHYLYQSLQHNLNRQSKCEPRLSRHISVYVYVRLQSTCIVRGVHNTQQNIATSISQYNVYKIISCIGFSTKINQPLYMHDIRTLATVHDNSLFTIIARMRCNVIGCDKRTYLQVMISNSIETESSFHPSVNRCALDIHIA